MQPNEMINGEWYYVKILFYWYVKINRYSDHDMNCYEYINTKSKQHKFSANFTTIPTEIRRMTLEEMEEYLPPNHPDRIRLIVPDNNNHVESLIKLLNNV